MLLSFRMLSFFNWSMLMKQSQYMHCGSLENRQWDTFLFGFRGAGSPKKYKGSLSSQSALQSENYSYLYPILNQLNHRLVNLIVCGALW
jgi:hypothetical protein